MAGQPGRKVNPGDCDCGCHGGGPYTSCTGEYAEGGCGYRHRPQVEAKARTTLSGLLDEISLRYANLDARPVVTDHEGPPKGFGSRPPGRVDVWVMRDARSVGYPVVESWEGGDGRVHCEDDSPPRSIPKAVTSLAEAVHEARGFTAPLPAGVTALCGWLAAQTDWMVGREDVAEVTADLRELRNQLRSATGDPNPKPLGHCIETACAECGTRAEPTATTCRYCHGPVAECAAAIFMPASEPRAPDEPIADLPTLRCTSCGGEYTGRRLILLRLAGEKAGVS